MAIQAIERVPAPRPLTLEEKQEVAQHVHRAYSLDPKRIEYRDQLKVLVVRPSERSILRKYFGRGEIIFAYATSKDVWYPAPNLLQNPGQGTAIYFSECPRKYDPDEPRWIPSEDRRGRKYLLVPAFKSSYVPVCQGTDPALGNWLAADSQIKTVYDAYCYRHPAMDGVDYAAHGFKLLQGRIWWPVTNGNFKATFHRIRDPYFEGYRHLFVPEDERAEELNRLGIAAAGAAGAAAGGMAAAGVAANMAHLAIRPDYEAIRVARAQDRRDREIAKQKPVIEALNLQDSSDLTDEIITAIQTQAPLETIQDLIRSYPEIHLYPEHRGKAAIKAAIFRKTAYLELILNTGPIFAEARGAAVIEAANQGDIPTLEILMRGNGAIPDEAYGQAVIRGAKFDNPELLELLLRREALPQDRGQAVVDAVARGSTRTVLTILASGSISTEKRGEAAIAACSKELNLLQALLNHGPILKDDRGKAVIEASLHGKTEHAKLLLAQRDSITPEHRGEALLLAARMRNRDLATILQESGPVAPLLLDEAARLFHA